MLCKQDDCPKVYFQLVLFNDDACVRWTKCMPDVLPDVLLSEAVRSFNAARAISKALLSGMISTGETNAKRESTSYCFLGWKPISLRPPSDTVVATCADGNIMAGFPMDEGEKTWLGLFAGGFPSIGDDAICDLLWRIALCSEIIPRAKGNCISKLESLWGCLSDFAGLQAYGEEDVILKTMIYLRALGESHVERGLKFWPQQNAKVSQYANCKINYPESMLQLLQNARPSSRPIWVAAVCVISQDGFVLYHEGISASYASVFAWRYRVLSRTMTSKEVCDYDGGTFLRVWYASGPLCMCVHSVQDANAEQPSVTGSDLACLREQANGILLKVENYITQP